MWYRYTTVEKGRLVDHRGGTVHRTRKKRGREGTFSPLPPLGKIFNDGSGAGRIFFTKNWVQPIYIFGIRVK